MVQILPKFLDAPLVVWRDDYQPRLVRKQAQKNRDDLFARDSERATYRRLRSKAFRLAESPNVLTEFLYSVVDRNPAVC
jgi:hypothetical protein